MIITCRKKKNSLHVLTRMTTNGPRIIINIKCNDMNKKAYQQPRLHTVNIEQQPLLQDSITSVSGNAGLNSSISAGSGPARSRSYSDWDDEE